jgi:hypothetical protein
LDIARLSKGAPATRISPAAFAQESKALTQLGQAMAEVGEKIYKLQAQSELSKANTTAIQGRKEIELTKDIEPQGWLERRDKELLDLKQNVLKTIRNPLARQQFELEYDRDVIDTNFRLKTIYTRLNIGDTLNSFYQERNSAEEEIYSATSEQERQLKIDKIGSRYSELGITGVMTQERAGNEFVAWRKGLDEGKLEYDLRTNLPYALAELEKGSQGVYKDIPRDKRVAAIVKGEALLKKEVENIEIVSLQQQLNNQTAFDEKLKTGFLLPNALKELEDGVSAGLFNEKWAKARKKAILYTGGINEEKMDEFEAKMILKTNDITARYKVKEKRKRKEKDAKEYLKGIQNLEIQINEGKANGLITQATYNELMTKLNNATTAEATSKIITGRPFTYDVADADKYFKRALNVEDEYQAVREFFFKLNENEDATKEERIKFATDIAENIRMDNRNAILESNDVDLESKEKKTPTFTTEAEAEKANLPVGTEVIIAGKKYRVKP